MTMELDVLDPLYSQMTPGERAVERHRVASINVNETRGLIKGWDACVKRLLEMSGNTFADGKTNEAKQVRELAWSLRKEGDVLLRDQLQGLLRKQGMAQQEVVALLDLREEKREGL